MPVRLFIAVEISDEVKEKIAKIQSELPSDKIKIVDPKLIHITLKFLGETDESKINRIKEALSSLLTPQISLKCKGVGVFPDEKFIRAVWVGLEEDEGFQKLKGLADEIEKKMVALGFEKNDYPFSPHITIGRPRDKVEISGFIEKYKKEEFGGFTVSGIKLKKSTLTPKGPIYGDL